MAAATSWVPTTFLRGGTSKGLFFTDAELPLALADASQLTDAELVALSRRDAVLRAAMGSPDPFGRQLNGMGGGASSLSKAMVVGRSQRPGIDLDYTFAQVSVDGTEVDYSGNCGNLSSGVVPFALAAGLLNREDGAQRFSLFNINTGKRVDVELTVVGGQAAVNGALTLPGVAGSGSPIELVYPDPSGSRTTGLLPTGSAVDMLRAGDREVRASLVDAAIPLILVSARELGLRGTEIPAELEAQAETMQLLERVRRAGAVRAGLCADEATAPLAVPKIVVLAQPADAVLLDGTTQPMAEVDLLARTLSMGRVHGAVPGTGAMCVAAAALIPGTIAHELVRAAPARGAVSVRIGTPSGAVTAAATCAADDHGDVQDSSQPPTIVETSLARTARILMRGEVAVELA